MSPKDLPSAYLRKCVSRLKALQVLHDDKNYSDVVRESQEVVELCSKGILRIALIEPPHRHDLGAELSTVKKQFSKATHESFDALITANHWLRREREMAFYGADDFDPTEGYSLQDASRAFDLAKGAVKLLEGLIKAQVS